jgi:hypothetical protein
MTSPNFYLVTRRQLREIGLPDTDPLDDSRQTFADGGHYRIEVPTINSAQAAKQVLLTCAKRGLVVNRITETRGLFRHTITELREYVALGNDHGVEVLMSVGPRATYDIGGGVQTVEGARNGYRLRGQEQLVRAVEDIKRAVEIGLRGFVVYDEGLLSVLGKLRSAGHLPPETVFKVSAHCGHGNPAAAQLLESLGANSFNPVRDLTIPMVSAIRKAISIPIDVHVDNPRLSGGFVRTYDAPEFVRVASPVHLKTGNSALDGHGTLPTQRQVMEVIDQVEIVSEFMNRHYPEARQFPSKHLNSSSPVSEPDLDRAQFSP